MEAITEAILKTLCYRDIFDFPLTASEVYAYLVEVRTNEAAVKMTLEQMAEDGIIGSQDGFYFLAGRGGLSRRRVERTAISEQKYERAFGLAKLLKKVPFVRAVFITGALAAGNADEGDDLDFLVITAPSRVWLVRLLSYVLFAVKGVKRSRNVQTAPNKVCLNMFLAEDALELPDGERNLFTAHEICLARPLWARDQLHLRFLGENAWVKEHLPNIEIPKIRKRESEEAEKSNRLFDWLDERAYRVQVWYMRPRITREIVERDRIMFHPVDLPRKILSAHKVKFYSVLHAPKSDEETA